MRELCTQISGINYWGAPNKCDISGANLMASDKLHKDFRIHVPITGEMG